MDSNSGLFVVFEGIDGAGKTTQVDLLTRALRDAGETVVRSKEPTAGPWGMKVRESALTGRFPIEEELYAFEQDRREHLETLILPALARNEVVVLDRYYYSTIAYQGRVSGNPEAIDAQMRAFARTPDIVFLLDSEPELCVRRVRSRDGAPNHFEDVEDLRQARAIFLSLLPSHPEIVRIEAAMPIEAIHAEVSRHLIDGPLLTNFCAKSYGCHDTDNCGFRMTSTCRWARVVEKLAPVPFRSKVAKAG